VVFPFNVPTSSARPSPLRSWFLGRRPARAVTFLEVVCSVVILSVVAAVTVGAINAIVSGQQRSLKRLGAAELANRLMLQYLDEETSLPSESLPIEYGPDRYRWTTSVTPISLVPAKEPEEPAARPAGTAPPRPTGGPAGAMGVDQLRAVTFRVWLADPSGAPQAQPGAPEYVLTRIVHPMLGPLRNPDRLQRLQEDPAAMQRFIQQLSGLSGGAPGAPTPDSRRSPPASDPAPTGGRPK